MMKHQVLQHFDDNFSTGGRVNTFSFELSRLRLLLHASRQEVDVNYTS